MRMSHVTTRVYVARAPAASIHGAQCPLPTSHTHARTTENRAAYDETQFNKELSARVEHVWRILNSHHDDSYKGGLTFTMGGSRDDGAR